MPFSLFVGANVAVWQWFRKASRWWNYAISKVEIIKWKNDERGTATWYLKDRSFITLRTGCDVRSDAILA
jgi:hypothetical protein